MDMTFNPYTPGSGIRPLAFAGRHDEINAFAALIARTERGMSGRGLMLTGLRGVGKTVLLNKLHDMATSAQWITVQFEASPGKRGQAAARNALGSGIAKAALRFKAKSSAASLKRMLQSITSFNASLGISCINLGVERDPSRAPTGNLEVDFGDAMESVATTMAEDGKGFAIFIDEIQDLDDELLEAILVAQHAANQKGLPFYIIGAGLPGIPARLSKVRSYAERLFDYREISRLSPEEAESALEAPAHAQHAAFDKEALSFLLTESGLYPYFIQEFGSALWEVAETSPFRLSDARNAVALGMARLDRGFFRSRWDRATPSEREFLQAMAIDGGEESHGAEVAQRLGRDIQGVGPVRAKLIEKGLVYAPTRGKIAYTVPSFHLYISRRSESE